MADAVWVVPAGGFRLLLLNVVLKLAAEVIGEGAVKAGWMVR